MRDWLLLCVLSLFVTGTVAVAQEKAKSKAAKPKQPVRHIDADRVGVRFYKVRMGDSLHRIAQRTLGRFTTADRILAENPGLNPVRLRVGQVIRLPSGGVLRATTQSPDAARALRRARLMIQAAERSPDAKAAQKALDEAEKWLMQARKALWKQQMKLRQQRKGEVKKAGGSGGKPAAGKEQPKPKVVTEATFFQVFARRF